MIKTLGLAILLVTAAVARSPSENNCDGACNKVALWNAKVQTTLGPVVGTRLTVTYPGLRPIVSFYHIPIGQDTSGANRFKLPVVRDAWTEDLDVTDSGRIKEFSCLQVDPTNVTIPQGSEDCLGLHVYTPKLPTVWGNPNLPVIFYIYGGSYVAGDGAFYNPLKLLDEDVVLVAVNYRLGPLGFYTDFTDEAPGNQALFDQLLGLEWVRDNIANFGGNPDLVTIMGESAGGLSVGHHVISPLSQGLFHRAIIQSVAPLSPFAIEENPTKEYPFLSSQTGCPVDENDPATYPIFTACLKNMVPPYTLFLLHAYFTTLERAQGHHGMKGNSPVIQRNPGTKHFITEDSLFPLAQGNFNQVPLLMGANKHDGTFVAGIFYNDYIKPLNKAENAEFWKFEAIDIFTEMLEIYDDSHVVVPSLKYTFVNRLENATVFSDLMYGYIDLLGAVLLKGPIARFAELASNRVPVYLYSFDYEGQYTLWSAYFSGDSVPPVPHGVAHGDELLYLFGYPAEQNEADALQTKNMVKTWVNFARTGNPTPDGANDFLPEWPQYKQTSPKYMKINSQGTVAEDYTQEYVISVTDKVNGHEIPGYGDYDKGLKEQMRTISHDRMEAFFENLEKGKFRWDARDEELFFQRMKQIISGGGDNEKH